MEAARIQAAATLAAAVQQLNHQPGDDSEQLERGRRLFWQAYATVFPAHIAAAVTRAEQGGDL